MPKSTYVVMTFGLGGNHADGYNESFGCKFTSSWYIGPEELKKYIDSGHYEPESIEGCWLVDQREVVKANPGLAFTSPMCDPKLKDGEIDSNPLLELVML